MTASEMTKIKPTVLHMLAADENVSCEGDLLSEIWDIARLNSDYSLVVVPCWQAAYNAGSAYAVIENDMQSAPVLVTDSGVAYDNGYISYAMKGRGLGDCWSHQTWVWDGRTFVESARGDTGRCKLIRPGGAWDIPSYVSQVSDN